MPGVPNMMSLSTLQTESRNPLSSGIGVVSTIELCNIINKEDAQVASAVGRCLEDIAVVIDLISERVRNNGRVIYIGAGTSGRLGILDASEIPPTFSAPYSQFIGLIAGGDDAIRKAVEGAEDSTTLPVADLDSLSPPLSTLDTVLGIASSGRTPYVLGGLEYAHSRGVLAIGIACVKPSDMRGRCNRVVECVVGPEIVTGSTRLKAGTAIKMILNMISTSVMIKVGKTYGNLGSPCYQMVDVNPSNNKLVDRARRIFRTIAPVTQLSDSDIDDLIQHCGGNVKLALVVDCHQCTIPDARVLLDKAGGVLKHVLQTVPTALPPITNGAIHRIAPNLVLCVDAGGTKCKAVIANKDGVISQAEAGPCNFVTLGHDAALSSLKQSIINALCSLPSEFAVPTNLPLERPIFAAVWIGGAGLDRAADLASMRRSVAALLNISNPETLLVTNDAALVSSAITKYRKQSIYQPLTGGIVLIVGTGSIAYSYELPPNAGFSLPKPVNRTGGWGHLLGDEGSAFAIGREAIRAALQHRDQGLSPTPLHQALLRYFGCQAVGELLSAVYLNAPSTLKGGQDSSVFPDPKLRIAEFCRVVFDRAFPPKADVATDSEALEIARRAAASAADIVIPLLRCRSGTRAATSVLILGGALAQVEKYRSMIVQALRIKGYHFLYVEHVANPAEAGIETLKSNFLRNNEICV